MVNKRSMSISADLLHFQRPRPVGALAWPLNTKTLPVWSVKRKAACPRRSECKNMNYWLYKELIMDGSAALLRVQTNRFTVTEDGLRKRIKDTSEQTKKKAKLSHLRAFIMNEWEPPVTHSAFTCCCSLLNRLVGALSRPAPSSPSLFPSCSLQAEYQVWERGGRGRRCHDDGNLNELFSSWLWV